MKDLGEAQSLLIMEVVRNQDLSAIMLPQSAKIDAALKEFRMEDRHPCTTPALSLRMHTFPSGT